MSGLREYLAGDGPGGTSMPSADLVVDVDNGHTLLHGQPVHGLTPHETQLLVMLARDPSRLFVKQELLHVLWGYQSRGPLGSTTTRTLDSHASRLRTKLRDAGGDGLIVNVWGKGYRLVEIGHERRVEFVETAADGLDINVKAALDEATEALDAFGRTLAQLGTQIARVSRQHQQRADARRPRRAT